MAPEKDGKINPTHWTSRADRDGISPTWAKRGRVDARPINQVARAYQLASD
jgi:hypothetical protein